MLDLHYGSHEKLATKTYQRVRMNLYLTVGSTFKFVASCRCKSVI